MTHTSVFSSNCELNVTANSMSRFLVRYRNSSFKRSIISTIQTDSNVICITALRTDKQA